MCGAVADENLGPLGGLYRRLCDIHFKLREYPWFKENHLATAHISIDMLEYTTAKKIISRLGKTRFYF